MKLCTIFTRIIQAMNKLLKHYLSSVKLAKEDLTPTEKEEIISTIKVLNRRNSTAEEREREFTTMCFNYGMDDDEVDAAKAVFLYTEDAEAWERSIIYKSTIIS